MVFNTKELLGPLSRPVALSAEQLKQAFHGVGKRGFSRRG